MDRKRLSRAVAKATDNAPCSLRALAQEAGVPNPTLVWIRKGKREATMDVAAKVAAALRRWAERCEAEAERVESAMEG